MLTIKFSSPWAHNYYKQTLVDNNYKLEINNDCHKADFWFIWGGLLKQETVLCPRENIIYITDEAHELRKYNQNFLNQFDQIWAVRSDITHKKIVSIHEPQLWYFNKTRTELENLIPPAKTNDLSVVSSDLTTLPGHKLRYAFVNKMIGHFKDKLHVYGRGFNPVSDKWQAIAPYKYSIAIENNVIPNYFTEKITECFLSYTMPIYYGCPNIKEYFDERAMIIIDINDYKASINTIEKAISENRYEAGLKYIEESRKKVLNEYHVFAQLRKFAGNQSTENLKLIENTILPEKYFNQKDAQAKEMERLTTTGLRIPLNILLKAIKHKLHL